MKPVEILRELVAIPSVSSVSNVPVVNFALKFLDGWKIERYPYDDPAGTAKLNIVAATQGAHCGFATLRSAAPRAIRRRQASEAPTVAAMATKTQMRSGPVHTSSAGTIRQGSHGRSTTADNESSHVSGDRNRRTADIPTPAQRSRSNHRREGAIATRGEAACAVTVVSAPRAAQDASATRTQQIVAGIDSRLAVI